MEKIEFVNQAELDRLAKLCQEAGLDTKNDIFFKPLAVKEKDATGIERVVGWKQMVIIKRQGISKIQAKHNITVEVIEKQIERYEYQHKQRGQSVSWDVWMYGKGSINVGDQRKVVWTFSSGNHANCSNDYIIETVEKRLRTRLVLELAGLYQEGIFGEDESTEFQEEKGEKMSDKLPKLGPKK